MPCIAKVEDEWFAVFGSGPSACECDDGTTTNSGHIFVVNLETGAPYKNGANDWLFETSETKAFMNSPVSHDKGMNYSMDAVYFGEAYYSGSWKGKVYKVTIPVADAGGVYDDSVLTNYSENPLDGTNPWKLSRLFDSDRPITGAATTSVDDDGNTWVYVGTGRYFNTADKSTTATQYLYGIKDPYFNDTHACYHSYAAGCVPTASDLLDSTDLLNTDDYVITNANVVYDGGTVVPNLENLVKAEDGWIRTLATSKERILAKPALLGGIVFVPSFVPSSDVCGFGGDSYLYGLYYLTGTAYYDAVFPGETTTVAVSGVGNVEQVDDRISLGYGKASSMGIHVGMGDDSTGYVQQSTGTIVTQTLNPALNVKSGLTSWIQR
jgi:type IV pilus assembly protein PilY1